MGAPRAEQIERRGRGTTPDADDATGTAHAPARWTDVETLLRSGTATCWLGVATPHGVHTRPVFAAWTGDSLVLASNPGAAKSGHLDATEGQVSVAMGYDDVHLVVEGEVVRVTDEGGLLRAAQAMADVYDWPTTPTGDRLDAPYAAPTSGGPPFNVYEIAPTRAFAFPTSDAFEPTRFTW